MAQLDSDELDAPTQTVVIGAESGVATLAVPAGISTVLFRVRAINLYPQENVGDAVDTCFQLNSEAGEEIARAVLSATYRAASPWGAEVLVTWLCVDGQILPGVTEVCSMGPKPIPPGTHLALRGSNGAPEMVGLINGDQGRSIPSSREDLGDGLQETLFILAEEIAAGDKLVIISAVKTSNSEPSEFGIRLPAVVLRPSESDFEFRDTRLLAAYPVTPSGAPLSSFVPTPTVLNREIEKE
ncbi:hypothetical protein [Microbacterium sp. CFBP 8794]|uniref:hypothetical protein n=1 Tax=Microbacterium sp. CFBP 8794 TaxID=2775269 RepID=UPI00177BA8A6|nr:hypothetical protein [Microbacterium sp. CFBP 8794]MBD8478951.1 hypothetical protein [Microbacterium sp. CFBP 8794]